MAENRAREDVEEFELNDGIVIKKEGDFITVELCEYINMYIYPHPKNSNRVAIELDNYLEDFPKLIAVNRNYDELDMNVKSINDVFDKLKTDRNFLLKIISEIDRHGILNDEVYCRRLYRTPTTFRMLCPQKVKIIQKEEKRILDIIYYGDKIEMSFEDDPCKLSWVLEQHPNDPNSVILSFVKDGREVVSVVRSFEYFSVDKEIHNLRELFEEIKDNADYYMSYLINTVDTPVDDVKVIDKRDVETMSR
jgi:hypothetical protein